MQSKLIFMALPGLIVLLQANCPMPHQHKAALQPQNNTLFEHVRDIPVPAGFKRPISDRQSYMAEEYTPEIR